MNKLKVLLLTFFLINSLAYANFNDIFIADIQYDWIDKSELEKEEIVSEIRELMFSENYFDKLPELKKQLIDWKKDKNYKEHYLAASSGLKEYKNFNLSAFYYKKQKHIYMYALQDKADISMIYYYDALGNLRYVDYVHGEFPEGPYYSFQYKSNGNPVSAIYYVSKDTQYVYEPDGSFKGVWYKHKLYDNKSKIILTRTTY